MDAFSQLSTTDMANALLKKIAISMPCRVDGFHSLQSYRAVLHELDKTISSMKSLVCGRLNSLCDINRLLPPEVLARIFTYIPTSSCEVSRNFDIHKDLSQFCGLSATGDLNPFKHVLLTCRYWRDVALSTPSLWSELVVAASVSKSSVLPLAASQLLATSAVPLYVTVSDVKIAGAVPDLVNKLGSRVQECIFHHVNINVVQHWSSIGENLRICAFDRTDVHDASVLLFDGRTPMLKVLYIHHGVFLPINHFPALTTLVLDHGGQSRRGEGFTFEDFAEFLAHCPALQSLYLGDLQKCLPIPLAGHPPILTSTSVITLPHLHRLSIIGGIIENRNIHPSWPVLDLFSLLLTALQPPSGPLLAWLRSEANIPFEKTTRLLAHLIPSLTDFNCMRLTLDEMGSPSWSILYGLEVVTPHRSQGFRMDFPKGWTMDRTDLRATLSLFNVRTLWVEPGGGRLVERPIAVLQALPHATTLVLMLEVKYESEFEDDIRAMDSLVAREDEHTPCPELHTLCVYLNANEHGEQLRDALLARTNDGFPIKRLVVRLNRSHTESVLEQVQACGELVQDLTIVPYGETVPEELLWERIVPYECSHPSQVHRMWEAWD